VTAWSSLALPGTPPAPAPGDLVIDPGDRPGTGTT
jgi:hypothetical protein